MVMDYESEEERRKREERERRAKDPFALAELVRDFNPMSGETNGSNPLASLSSPYAGTYQVNPGGMGALVNGQPAQSPQINPGGAGITVNGTAYAEPRRSTTPVTDTNPQPTNGDGTTATRNSLDDYISVRVIWQGRAEQGQLNAADRANIDNLRERLFRDYAVPVMDLDGNITSWTVPPWVTEFANSLDTMLALNDKMAQPQERTQQQQYDIFRGGLGQLMQANQQIQANAPSQDMAQMGAEAIYGTPAEQAQKVAQQARDQQERDRFFGFTMAELQGLPAGVINNIIGQQNQQKQMQGLGALLPQQRTSLSSLLPGLDLQALQGLPDWLAKLLVEESLTRGRKGGQPQDFGGGGLNFASLGR